MHYLSLIYNLIGRLSHIYTNTLSLSHTKSHLSLKYNLTYVFCSKALSLSLIHTLLGVSDRDTCVRVIERERCNRNFIWNTFFAVNESKREREREEYVPEPVVCSRRVQLKFNSVPRWTSPGDEKLKQNQKQICVSIDPSYCNNISSSLSVSISIASHNRLSRRRDNKYLNIFSSIRDGKWNFGFFFFLLPSSLMDSS